VTRQPDRMTGAGGIFGNMIDHGKSIGLQQ
jgi:hypothetical protein